MSSPRICWDKSLIEPLCQYSGSSPRSYLSTHKAGSSDPVWPVWGQQGATGSTPHLGVFVHSRDRCFWPNWSHVWPARGYWFDSSPGSIRPLKRQVFLTQFGQRVASKGPLVRFDFHDTSYFAFFSLSFSCQVQNTPPLESRQFPKCQLPQT